MNPMKTILKHISLCFSLGLILGQNTFAAAPPASRANGNNEGGTPPAPNGTTVANCAIGLSRAELDINNVRARYLNAGDMFWDPALSLARYEVPKRTDNLTTSKNSIFAAAIWLGGVERGTNNVLVMVQTYRGGLRNYWPGPIKQVNQSTEDPTSAAVCSAWDQHFKCNRRTVKEFVDNFDAGLVNCDNIPEEIRFWPAKGNPFLKQKAEFSASPAATASLDQNLANFFDRDSNGVYNPCNGDYPLWAGTEADFFCGNDAKPDVNTGADQVLWWVCNDAGNRKNFQENTTTVPAIGMEVHYEAFAYASTDATNDMTFLRQKLYNKGSVILDNTYLAQWVDPDLGNAGDDYVGCDVMRGLGICYNGDEFDEGTTGYGENPPAVGVDFFRGPVPDNATDNIDWDLDCAGPETSPPDTNERITMSGFVYYNIGGNPRNGDPTKYTDFYNYLQNKWKDGTDITWGAAGLAPLSLPNNPKANYMFPNVTSSSDPYGFACGATSCSSPVTCPGIWNEAQAGNAPGDRRFLANNGPFTLQPGDVNECTIGIVWARATSGGPTGSFGKLLAADDLAQERFNDCFKRNVGPNNPNLEIIEEDRSLVFSIIPDVIVKNPLMTTETYRELNRRVSIGNPNEPQDLFYRFQGYKVYQLADDKVSVQDLNNPDRARLLEGDVNGDGNTDFTGLMDLKDGVSSINNEIFNADLDAYISTPMVKNSPDEGIYRTFKVQKDMFGTTGKLSNFKKYYYAVVAYGYIRNNQEKRPYIQGVSNYKVYTAIPHKLNSEAFGSSTSYSFGGGLNVTRITGIGNSGNNLELLDGEEAKILSSNGVQELAYKAGNTPIDIKIYNPKGVRAGNFQVRFTSRLVYKPTTHVFNVGDIIVADTGFALSEGYNTIRNRSSNRPGKARIIRVLPQDGGFVNLDVEMIGPAGVFTYTQDEIELDRGVYINKKSKRTGLRFHLESDTSVKGLTSDFIASDYWRLTEVTSNKVVFADKPVSEVSEQLIPEFGISLRPRNSPDPGTDIDNDLSANGALVSSIITDPDPLKQWIYGVSTSSYPWYRTDNLATINNYYNLDPKRSFQNMAGGGWLPYILTEKASFNATTPTPALGGPQLAGSTDNQNAYNLYSATDTSTLRSMARLQNVDIVFTSDKSKWTQVVVLQMDSIPASSTVRPKWTLAKSRRPSVNQNFEPEVGKVSPFDGTPSRGVSWFPGYAIDLDRGIRLNMMFSESSFLDPDRGNNLQWEPRANLSGLEGTRNFIYVLNTQYDNAVSAERSLDSLYRTFVSRPSNQFLPIVRRWHVENIMYAGLMGRGIDFVNFAEQPLGLTDVRVKLRVEKAFQPYAQSSVDDRNPTYNFKIEGGSQTGNLQVAKNALDLIRVVPNPYLSVSPYENGQIDNRVKIINLPTQCVVSIFNLSGTLVRQYNFDQSSSKPYAAVADGIPVTTGNGVNYQTFLDWDLKNQNGIPIASGVYLIHVKSDKLGERTLKWFGVLRPIDLDTFQ